jgi:hypothetical protein
MNQAIGSLSPWWRRSVILIVVGGLTALMWLAARSYKHAPPIPDTVVGPAGETIFTAADINGDQQVFLRYARGTSIVMPPSGWRATPLVYASSTLPQTRPSCSPRTVASREQRSVTAEYITHSLTRRSCGRNFVQSCGLQAEGNLGILLPAVTGAPEIDAFRAFLQNIADELHSEADSALPHVLVGAMIETPAALFMLDAIAERVDFLSLGTNDLLCHLFGSDRRGGKETAYEPSFLRALDLTVRAADAKGKPLSICGELAGAPAFTALLIGLGIRQFSMSPERLPEVRYNLSRISAHEATAFAHRVLGMHSASDVKRLLSENVGPWHKLLGDSEDPA